MQFRQLVRSYCIGQVLVLSLLIIGTAVMQIMLFPEVRLHARALCLLAVFFFFTGVFRFLLYMHVQGKERTYIHYYGWFRFLLCVVLTVAYECSLSGIGWVFVGQMVLFYVVQILFEIRFDRKLGKS